MKDLNKYAAHTTGLNLLHVPFDDDKIFDISNSMIAKSWQGAPLVAWGTYLLTGTHRSAAYDQWVMAYENDDADTVPILPVLDLEEYADELFGAEAAEEMREVVEAGYGDWAAQITYIAEDFDPDLAEQMGLDAH